MRVAVGLLALGAMVTGGCAEANAPEPEPPTNEALCDRAAYLITTPAGEQLSLEEADQLARACGWCPAVNEWACASGTPVERSQADFEARGRRLAVSVWYGGADILLARLEELGARLACIDEATLREASARREAGQPPPVSCFHVDFPPGTCVGDAFGEFSSVFYTQQATPVLPPTDSPCSCDRPRCQEP